MAIDRVGPAEGGILFRFGGGLHTRPGQDDIETAEAADGNNFVLDFQNKQLRNRKPFDKVGTAPNGEPIRGGISLREDDGTVTLLIQAGDTVYEWDGQETFTSRGTVSSTARLRGHWNRHYWALDDLVLVTDLQLAETVKTWNGTTLSDAVFTDEEDGTFGNFFAKYALVSNERAIFANTKDAVATPHLIVGSKVSDYTQITVANKPSSALGADDPFYLLSPDLKAINGLVDAFSTTVISTDNGQLFGFSGASATDFAMAPFYPGSAAAGQESLCYIGNDVIYGKRGRIESVNDTNRFGDSEYDNIAAGVQNVVDGYESWTVVYNSRINRVYAFPTGGSEVWVCDTAMLAQKPIQISPWMRWRTRHAMGFQPTFVMSMLDPVDGLEYIFAGDSSGNLYRIEGSGTAGDGGTEEVQMEWLSKVYTIPQDAQAHSFEGWISYVKDEAFTVILNFEFQGETTFTETVTIDVPTTAGRIYFGDSVYFGGSVYFGSPAGKLNKYPFLVPGQASSVQLRVQVAGVNDWTINEIGIRFNAVGR